jgi:anti-sigma B factor antagonist
MSVLERTAAALRRSGDSFWSRRRLNGAVIVRLAGELDMATWKQLDQQLSSALSNGSRAIVLDLSDVDYIDGHSIGLIAAAWTSAKDRGRSLRVSGLRGMPRDLFDILGLQSLVATPGMDNRRGHDGFR